MASARRRQLKTVAEATTDRGTVAPRIVTRRQESILVLGIGGALFTLLSEWLTQGLTGIIISERSMPSDGAIVVVVIALLVCWAVMAVPSVMALERLRWKGPIRPVAGWIAASFLLWLVGALLGGVGPLLFLLFWAAFGLLAGARFNPAPRRREAA